MQECGHVYYRLVVAVAGNPRLLIPPAEEVFHPAAILRVVEDIAHGCGMPSAATPGGDAGGIQMIGDPLERVFGCSHGEYVPGHVGILL